jgi:hypothetical protein
MALQHRETSPRGDIVVEHYFNKKNYEREVWLAPVNEASKRVLLYKHGRSVSILFSPDEQWLVINDFPTSTDGAPFLFKRGRGLNYRPIENVNIAEKVWQFVGKYYPIVLTQDFGHQYVEALRWSYDSKAFLVAAFGHTDSPEISESLAPWLSVFIIDGFRVTLDLNLMNRGALHSRERGEAAPSGPWK